VGTENNTIQISLHVREKQTPNFVTCSWTELSCWPIVFADNITYLIYILGRAYLILSPLFYLYHSLNQYQIPHFY
jgi:hypothetical protein